MTLGTAIFLSSLVLGVLVLYWLTRDRIRWGRLLRWVAALSLVCTIASAVAAWVYSNPFFWRGAVDGLDGFKLGDIESDILFKNSNYERVCEGRWQGLETKVYVFVESRCETVTRVELNGGSVRWIGKSSRNYDQVSWRYRNPVRFGSTLDMIRRDFGVEDFFREYPDRSRTYVFKRFNLAFKLGNDRLSVVKVFDPNVHYLLPNEQDETIEGNCFTKDGARIENGWKSAFNCEASTP